MLVKMNKFDSISEIKDPQYCVDIKCDCANCLVESVWVKLTSNNNEFIVSSMYKHPNGNIDHFVDSIEPIFSNIKDNVTYMVAGDININLMNTEDAKTSNHVGKILMANFIPYTDQPTRFCDSTATLIDYIMLKALAS